MIITIINKWYRMLKNYKGLLLIAFFAMYLNSCISFHGGYMNDSVSLSQPNFDYVLKNATGEAYATYLLGLGGWGTPILDGAKMDLYKKYNFSKNQALANVSISYKTTYFAGFVMIKTKCIITADIVEFKKD